MQDLTFGTLTAVFEEIFGRGLIWAMVAVAALVTLGWIYVLIRDRSLGMRQFLIAHLFMPVGAVLAVWFVMVMTKSHRSDIGGPVEVVVLFGIGGMGAVGGAILVDTLERLVLGRRAPRTDLRIPARVLAGRATPTPLWVGCRKMPMLMRTTQAGSRTDPARRILHLDH